MERGRVSISFPIQCETGQWGEVAPAVQSFEKTIVYLEKKVTWVELDR